MDTGVAVKVTVITAVLHVFVIWGIFTMVRLSLFRHTKVTGTLIRLSLVMTLLSGTTNLVGLLFGTIQGTWTLGETMCQLVGLTNLVLTSGATWIMAIAAVERYFRFLLASDHPSTFSQKNVNILVAGIYVLVILVATGPLYGLGEYSNFRGHVTLTITANSTAQNVSYGDKTADERLYVNILHQATVIGKLPDTIPCFVNHLEKDYGMTTSRYVWMDRGIRFLLRAWTERHAWSFLSAYQTDGLRSLVSRHLWQEELLWSARMEHLEFTAHLDQAEYRKYVEIYVPSQRLGQCTVDFTSPHVHATVWSGYQLVINTLLPLVLTLVVYLVLYARNPYTMSAFDKNLCQEDFSSLRIFCTSSMTSCFFSVLYFGVTLSNADGVYISPDVNFVVTFAYYSSSLATCVSVCCYDNLCCGGLKASCTMCWLYSRDSISNEISDIKLRQKALPRLSHAN
ncbi:uncharacterized protein LOC110448420 isoform X2 [Mizuhopecten yessoensis]|uniref:uncharacterized protein LOC110448420 isoform X2 n=1 Tax=Mizuhopecten yessoensis TaxID=6573 RepID=UPI000B45CE6D|nr:uncharacterized protein LOC110448420 isoform X2 [Mizuhopecten yessoensis]